MGNTTAKHQTTCKNNIEIGLGWDAENKREKHIDPYAYYTFNFYGQYSREVFLKANIHDPDLENKIKKVVEGYIWCTENSKFNGWASHVHHKGRKYLVGYCK